MPIIRARRCLETFDRLHRRLWCTCSGDKTNKQVRQREWENEKWGDLKPRNVKKSSQSLDLCLASILDFGFDSTLLSTIIYSSFSFICCFSIQFFPTCNLPSMQHYIKSPSWLKNNIWDMKTFQLDSFFIFISCSANAIFYVYIFSTNFSLFIFPSMVIFLATILKLSTAKPLTATVIIWWKWW